MFELIAFAGVQRFDRRDVFTLALGLGIRGLGLLDSLAPAIHGLRRARAAERVAPEAERDAPVRHRATRIFLRDVVELVDGRRVPKRVQERDAAIEPVTDRGVARRLELHLAEALGGRGAVFVLLRRCQRRQQNGARKRNTVNASHGTSGENRSIDLAIYRSMCPTS